MEGIISSMHVSIGVSIQSSGSIWKSALKEIKQISSIILKRRLLRKTPILKLYVYSEIKYISVLL